MQGKASTSKLFMEWMPQAIRDGIVVVLIISGPLVLAAAFIGLVVGVLQAATQVQEQTIGSALKIIGVFALIIFAGFWMYQYLSQYTTRTFTTAFTFVPRQTQKAVPIGSFEKEGFKEGFQGKMEAERLGNIPKITPPEKIETPTPESGIPIGAPYLGTPEIPKPPQVTKIVPAVPQAVPEVPVRPKLPLADYQEPKSIVVPKQKKEVVQTETKSPSVTGDTVQEIVVPLNTDTTGSPGDIDKKQLNVVPGKPAENKKEIVTDPMQKKEVFSENTKTELHREEGSNQNNSSSWLE